MWPQYAQEIHPVELHELSLEELTGTRPSHRGTLMYLKQRGIPPDSIHFADTGPQRGHLQNVVRAIEHDFYSGPVTRHPEVKPLRNPRQRAKEVREQPQRHFNQGSGRAGRAMSSRELTTGRRDGRAAALFQRMKDRSDQYVVDQSTVPAPAHPNTYDQGYEERGRPWQQRSPWEAAAEHPLGLPDEAFHPPIPKPKPKLQNPVPVKQRGPPGYNEVDSIRQRQQGPGQTRPVKIGCTWKGGNDKTRFHDGVQPYMNYNRAARGWNPNQFQSDAEASYSDQSNEYDEADSWGGGRGDPRSPRKVGPGGYNDFNTRPKSWHREEDLRTPLQERPGNYQQGRPRASDIARSRQVVRAVVGPKAWGDESDDL